MSAEIIPLPVIFIERAKSAVARSWYCDQCQVEVYDRRCLHCGKTKREIK